MIKPQSDDPDIEAAAHKALSLVEDTLHGLPKAESFDYGGHMLHIGEYGVCTRCTTPIAEAQQAYKALMLKAEAVEDPTVKEHLSIAARLFELEAEAAAVRAELHNGRGSEKILNALLFHVYNRDIHDSYDHSHNGGN